MEIREEREEDFGRIDDLVGATMGPAERCLVRQVRNSVFYIPPLALVAVDQTEIVGYGMLSCICVETEASYLPALGLAPVVVEDSHRGCGIGTELVRRGLEASRRLASSPFRGAPVFATGASSLYPNSGFAPARGRNYWLSWDPAPDFFWVADVASEASGEAGGRVRRWWEEDLKLCRFVVWLLRHDRRPEVIRRAKSRRDRITQSPDSSDMKPLGPVRKLIVHHTGYQAADVSLLRSYHRLINGWSDIGYHFLVANGRRGHPRAGMIEAGRSLEREGAHCLGYNQNSIGVCLVDSKDCFRSTSPSSLQYHALDNLLLELCLQYDLKATDVVRHGDLNTARNCPPPAVNMEQIRSRLATRLASKRVRRVRFTYDTRRLLGPDYGRRQDLHETLLDFWWSSGVDRLLVAGHWGIDQSSRLDAAARFVALAHVRGFEVLLYTGPYGTERPEVLDTNPELRAWQQRDREGQSVTYGGLLMFCPNAPYLERYRGPLIKRTLMYCDLDGVFLDVPWFLRRACHCQFCQAIQSKEGRQDQACDCLSCRRWGERDRADLEAHRSRSNRDALARLCLALRNEAPTCYLAVNANAPGTRSELAYTGARTANLSGLFDEMVTELQFDGKARGLEQVRSCLRSARTQAPGAALSFATMLDGAHEKPTELVEDLFRLVHAEAAGMWFSDPRFQPGTGDHLAKKMMTIIGSR